MKNLKVVILVFALAGIVSMFLPMGDGTGSMFSLFMEHEKFQLFVMLAAFAVPAIVCAMALARPPARMWHGIAALAGFALAAVKARVWSTITQIMDLPLPGKLMLIAVVGGVITSIIAAIQPESKTTS